MNAQLVTGIAGQITPPIVDDSGLTDCARSLKRLRRERERAAVQREIDRLQGQGSTGHGDEIDALLNQKRDLAREIEGLT